MCLVAAKYARLLSHQIFLSSITGCLRFSTFASFSHPISSDLASLITPERVGLVASDRRYVTPIFEFVLMFNCAICSPIPFMFEYVPSARLALSMTLAETVSAPVLLIVASPYAVWFFHAAGVDEPS